MGARAGGGMSLGEPFSVKAAGRRADRFEDLASAGQGGPLLMASVFCKVGGDVICGKQGG